MSLLSTLIMGLGPSLIVGGLGWLTLALGDWL